MTVRTTKSGSRLQQNIRIVLSNGSILNNAHQTLRWHGRYPQFFAVCLAFSDLAQALL